MTTEQLYINGQLVDLKPDSHITLTIQSNLFRDINDIVGNHTYSVALPKTANNMRILGNLDVVQDTGRNQYTTMPCRYVRNGIVLIENGCVNILSVEDEEVQICITWGVCNTLAAIKNKEAKLTDLTSTESIVWKADNKKFTDYSEARSTGIFYAEYNPYVIEDDDSSWQTKNEVAGDKIRIDYDTNDGMIIISGTIGDVVDINPDINYHAVMSAAFEVNGGDGVYIVNFYAVEGTYIYAFLDSSRKIIQCSTKVGSVHPLSSLNMTAPSNAAYFVCNISVSSSICEIFRYRSRDSVGDGTPTKFVFSNMQHPVVSVSWILARIGEQYGISVNFINANTLKFRQSLAIPLITKKGEKDSTSGVCRAKFSGTSIGTLGVDITTNTGIVENKTGTIKTLAVKHDCKAQIDIQTTYTIPEPKKYSGTNNHGGGGYMVAAYPCYIKMIVTSGNEDPKEYLTIDDASAMITISSGDVINGVITRKTSGWGEVDLKKGDAITLQLCNAGSNVPKTLSGTISITAKVSEDVVVNQPYPIVANLPDIKLIDLFRTLAVVTGTYPKQLTDENVVKMVDYDAIWNSVDNAKNWTKKLIPRTTTNTPRKTEYVVSQWCQKNWYKWKEDEKTVYNYDGVLDIDNSTLEEERNVIELPFAASDESRVPLYERTTSSGSSFGDTSVKTGSTYKGCEPRLMTFSANDAGKAVLSFPDTLDLQNVIDTKYNHLRKTLNNAKIITEYVSLTDLDIQAFDDTIPVYLAQYGAYFAVLEIKQTSGSYCEVTMLKLNIDREE